MNEKYSFKQEDVGKIYWVDEPKPYEGIGWYEVTDVVPSQKAPQQEKSDG